MQSETPLDRVLQAGGDWVTMLFWLLAVVGAVTLVLDLVPMGISIAMTGTGFTIYWLRYRDMTVLELLGLILNTKR